MAEMVLDAAAEPASDLTVETADHITVETAHLITEDDTPVDNIFSEKQQRLLTEPLYTSWAGVGEDRPFLAAANVGIFMANKNPAIVPDVLLSLDVVMPEDWWTVEGRSYAVWELGKTPDLVIEIVSNKRGGELGAKMRTYAHLRIPIYVVLDPDRCLQDELLAVYLLAGFDYQKSSVRRFPEIGLGLVLWEGDFEQRVTTWLRWTDLNGDLIPCGSEQRARADKERARAERLIAQLRAAGIEPDP